MRIMASPQVNAGIAFATKTLNSSSSVPAAAAALHMLQPSRPSSCCRLLEICVDSVASARTAALSGTDRIELCASLIEGGVTPSVGCIRQVTRVLKEIHQQRQREYESKNNDDYATTSTAPSECRLMVLIRPRSGDFRYDPDELDIMRSDICACGSMDGVSGIVTGALSSDGTIDSSVTSELLQLATSLNLDFTFHRAFDMTHDLNEAAEVLIKLGVKRILTSGGYADAIQGQEVIKSLVNKYSNQLTILAGGGLTVSNIPSFISFTGVTEIHASLRSAPEFGQMVYRKSNLYMGTEKRNDGLHVEYANKYTSADLIQQVMKQISTA